ncbi:MAG TPA: hypothetical protein VMZ28_16835 [Kofleriaceae bacterium]|nr:hypothetical protein [Kofleriaceae bacterium]
MAGRDNGDLADVVVRDVDQYVDSLDALEVAMLLFRERQRTWSPEDVARELRISVRVSRRELDRMRTRGAASEKDGDYRFDQSDVDKAAAVARIAAAYGTKRIELINYVASQTLKRIQSIADAFKLKKDE